MSCWWWAGRLEFAEERDKEGYTEVHDEAVEDGERDEVFAAVARDDRQRGVHGGRTAYADGSQGAEPSGEKWRGE